MSELNFELLHENIRALLKKHDLTQSELASIAGMSQGNLSKALNPEEKKQFTLEQLYLTLKSVWAFLHPVVRMEDPKMS